MSRKPYPTDVGNKESAFVAPDLTLMTEDAAQQSDNTFESGSKVHNAL